MSPPGLQPFEWGIICTLFGALVAIIVYVWNDAKRRDERDKQELRETLADIRETIKGFSTRVDGAFGTVESRLQLQGERLASLAAQQLNAEKRIDDVGQDAHGLEVSFVRMAEQVAGLRGRLGLSSPSGTMPAFSPPTRHSK
jgi:hypothetical protein